MFIIIFLWAMESTKFENAISICTKIFKGLINLQLASYAILQIPAMREVIASDKQAETILLNIGLLFNFDAEGYKVIEQPPY